MKIHTMPGPEQLQEAAKQLGRSDRGRSTMRELDGFLRGPARCLDADNRNALLTLLYGFYGSYPGTTLEVIESEGPQDLETK